MAVFEKMIRPRERNLNLYGMAHLGGDDLMASALKSDGIAMVKRSSTRMQFLMKASRSRNPRRGLLFIKKYLQAIWPNIWQAEPLWLRIDNTANYPAQAIPLNSAVPIFGSVTGDYTDGSGLPVLNLTDEAGRFPLSPIERVNYVSNNSSMQFAAVGLPGDDQAMGNWGYWPGGWWYRQGDAGTRFQIVAKGEADGMPYIDVRFTGRPWQGGRTAGSIYFAGPSEVTMARGQQWTGSAYVSLIAGSLANVASIGIGYDENSASTNLARGLGQAFTPTATMQRYSMTRENFDAAGAHFANHTLQWACLEADKPVDFTLRIALPQMENGKLATAPIRTAGTFGQIVTRPADYALNEQTGIATFRAALGVPPTCVRYFLTGRIRITLPVSSDNGLGLDEIAKAFRSTLPARLMLEFKLGMEFDTSGPDGLKIANGAAVVMPIMATGTLQL